MPTVTLPDGKRFTVPAGTTPDEVLAFAENMGGPPKSVSEQAKANLNPASPGNQRSDRVIAAAAWDEKNLYGRFAKDAALTVAAGVAAPFTGGASLLPAMALSGAAGAAGSLVGMGIQKLIGSSEAPRDLGDVTSTLGLDAASFVAGEGVGRGIGVTLKSLVPKLAIRSAAKVDRGLRALDTMFKNTSEALTATINDYAANQAATTGVRAADGLVASARRPGVKGLLAGTTQVIPETGQTASKGTFWVDVGPEFKKIVTDMKAMAERATPFTKRYGGQTTTAAEMVQPFIDNLKLSEGTVGVMQPLHELIDGQHSLQSAAWRDKGLSKKERTVLKEGAESLAVVIKKALKEIGPEAEGLYAHFNTVAKAQDSNAAAIDVSNAVLRTIFRKTLITSAGAGIGYAGGGHNLKGALAGAAIANAMPYASAYALELTLRNPNAAPMLKKAIELTVEGRHAPAKVLAARAMGVAGVRAALTGALPTEDQPQPAE